MSGAGCAKIIIDNYAALGGSSAAMSVTGEASCEALMVLIEEHPELEQEALAISDKACHWADEIRAWTVELEKEVRELAQGALAAAEDGGGPKRPPRAEAAAAG